MSRAMPTRKEATEASARPFSYLDFYRSPAVDRIRVIKSGFSAKRAKLLIGELRFDQKIMLDALNLKTATINRKAANNQVLSPEDSERVLGLGKLLGQVEAMLEDSVDADKFDARAWLSRWLREPVPALGHRPIELLDTMEGQALISRTLSQMQSGAYA